MGEVGATGAATVWKLTHLPESTVDASDSSHSGIVAGVKWFLRVGLDGQDAAKKGWRKDCKAPLESISQSGFRLDPLDVGEERGGVTGALFDIRRGGREEGMEAKLQRKGKIYDEGFDLSQREGLGKEDDVGLAW